MYKIIIDSCGELTPAMKESGHYASVPLTLRVGEEEIMDDENFDQASLLAKIAACETAAKSACPSPNLYMEAMEDEADHIYVVTLSAQLSGSYNSACLGKDLYEEDDDSKCIHVFDSKSASIGETLIGLKIEECEEAGMSFEEVVAAVDDYIEQQHTFFVLETLDTLRKAGRLSNLKAAIAGTLNIKPIMGSTEEGSIQQLAQARGMSKAIDKMISCLMEVTENPQEKIVAISHCNAPEKAMQLKDKLLAMCNFKDIFIVDTQGVSSLYANDGGLIMVV
ncbi:MAG: DegV family protein [Bacteroidaceae bacterium]|nr:DegV family protein [Bacteroidaceae bacterium]